MGTRRQGRDAAWIPCPLASLASRNDRVLVRAEHPSPLALYRRGTPGEETAMKNLEELFHHLLKDIYFAEKQLVKALPKMAKATENPNLRQAFEHHLEETKGQVQRLEQVFKIIGKTARGEKCPAILGLVEEGEEVMEKGKDGDVIDAGLLAGAQAVEHYEISRYGTMVAWAEQLGLMKAVPLLKETLKQEKAADATLSEIAMASVNREAA
jgi:ferritin-like metal-binding protein YciE